MPQIVLDASAALASVLPGEALKATADAIMDRAAISGAVVPRIWPLEISNVLLIAQRRGKITTAELDRKLAQLLAMPIEVEVPDHAPDWHQVVRLADRAGLTVYDTTYLDLAIRRGLPLATLDARLARASRDAGVETLA